MSYIPRQPWPGKNSGITKAEWEKGEDERMAGLEAAANREPYEPFKGIGKRMSGHTALRPSGNPQNPIDDTNYRKKVAMGAQKERSAAKKADETLIAKIQDPLNYKRGGRRSKRYRKTKKSKRSSTKRKRTTKSKRSSRK